MSDDADGAIFRALRYCEQLDYTIQSTYPIVMTAAETGSISADDDQNFYWAIGRYSWWTKGTCSCQNGKICADMMFHVDDMYNWDYGKGLDPLLGILHLVGLAKEYHLHGVGARRFKCTE